MVLGITYLTRDVFFHDSNIRQQPLTHWLQPSNQSTLVTVKSTSTLNVRRLEDSEIGQNIHSAETIINEHALIAALVVFTVSIHKANNCD